MMSMDFAGKYTHKQGEKDDTEYVQISNNLSQDPQQNLDLLNQTLNILKSKKRTFLAYAPLHGNSPQEFVDFTKSVLDLENKNSQKFDGFGIGGIANHRQKNNIVWNVDDKDNSRIKAGIIVSKVISSVRRTLNSINDNRPIHALGVGNADLIIPLVYAGADSFDNHTAWRRATDGSRDFATNVNDRNASGSFSKYLIPLLDRNGKVITKNKNNVLKYVKLNALESSIFCDCDICKKYSIMDIKKLYSQNDENFFFARILCYVHAINQHQIICKRLQNDINHQISIKELIKDIPDQELNKDLMTIIDSI